MKHKTSELEGALLDAAVAKALGLDAMISSQAVEVIALARSAGLEPYGHHSE